MSKLLAILTSIIISVLIIGCSNKVNNLTKSIDGFYEIGNPNEYFFSKVDLRLNGECIWYNKISQWHETFYGKWKYQDSIIYADFPECNELKRLLEYPSYIISGRQKFLYQGDSIRHIEENGIPIPTQYQYVYDKIER